MGSASNICVPDPWFDYKYKETSSIPLKQLPKRRDISISDARKIALSVYVEAEKRRQRFAEEELKICEFWEDVE